MFARLWWKDLRQFGPACAVIGLAAGAGMWLAAAWIDEASIRASLGFGLALVAPCLYAMAVGAAAFAGEREAGMLRWLDALPAPRGAVWKHKAGFALVSTAALAAGLGILAYAVLGVNSLYGSPGPGMVFVLSVAAACWGLLASATTRSVLVAAVLGVVLFLVVHLTISGGLSGASPDPSPVRHALAALAALGASALVFVRSAPPERSSAGRDWAWPRLRRERAGRLVAASPTWAGAAGRLAWLAYRQARGIWPALALLGLGLPLWAGLGIWRENPADLIGLVLAANGLAAILAGAWVFGSEQSGRTYRFLAHHGVRPALAWPVKTAVWVAALALLWLPGVLVFGSLPTAAYGEVGTEGHTSLAVAAVGLPTAFAVAVLCGMAFRRTITAVLLAIVLVIPVVAGLVGLVLAGLATSWWVLIPPMGLLAVAWAWAGPWMLDRPGASRWARLGVLLGEAVGGLFAAYVVARAGGLPATGPLPATLAASLSEAARPVPLPENAAPLYRQAWRVYADQNKNIKDFYMGKEFQKVLLGGWPGEDDDLVDFLGRHEKDLGLAREASARPRCQFLPLAREEISSQQEVWFDALGHLVGFSVEERRARGDLEGAWDDLVVLFRMARHRSGPVRLTEAVEGRTIERQALGQAMRWAADSRQTPEQLRAALASYRSLPPLLPLDQSWAADEVIARQTIALAPDRLRDYLDGLIQVPSPNARAFTRLFVASISTPWERERARRALRLNLLRNLASHRTTGDSRRPPPADPESDAILLQALETTPLTRFLAPALASTVQTENQNEVARRALVQILALRAWQLSHDGRLPERLEELVPTELDRLPNDPFAGPTQSFGYAAPAHQRLPLLGVFGGYTLPSFFRDYPGHPMILFSLGPDGSAPRFGVPVPWYQRDDRLVFPLADEPPQPVEFEPAPRASASAGDIPAGPP
jgi:ABC-type transport system involved in multi-copper enzyme maturation permease subunit